MRAFSILVLMGLSLSSVGQITLDPLSTTTICSGASFDVSYQALGSYDPGNVFSVQLSDASGDFSLPTNIGSVLATTSGTITCNGALADGTGYHLRVVSSSPVEVGAASAEVLTFANPNAGMSTAISLCGAPASIDLSNLLNGSPDVGGQWTIIAGTGTLVGPDGPYIGLAYGANILEYTLDVAGCTASAQLTVNCVEPANAGISTVLAICSSGAPVNMFASLNGTPQAGGTWMNPAGSAVSNMFDPANDIPGMYVYTVVSDPPCMNASATLLLTLVQAPDAGLNAAIAICSNDVPFSMTSQLQGSPAPGGTWAFNAVPHAPIYIPGTDVSGTYTYTVFGQAPCTNAVSTLEVVESVASDAGLDGSITLCSSAGAFSLITALGGTPQPGGSWSGAGVVGGMFDPATMFSGPYVYTVIGAGTCSDASATVSVTVNNCFQQPGTEYHPPYPDE